MSARLQYARRWEECLIGPLEGPTVPPPHRLGAPLSVPDERIPAWKLKSAVNEDRSGKPFVRRVWERP